MVDCGDLRNPVSGSVMTPTGTTFASIAEYSCNAGFVLIGNQERTCLLDGQWSGSEPTCDLSGTWVYKDSYCILIGTNLYICCADSALTGESNESESVVIIVCASVGGFALVIIIIVIIIVIVMARSRRSRQEIYVFSVAAQRQRSSQIGIYVRYCCHF